MSRNIPVLPVIFLLAAAVPTVALAQTAVPAAFQGNDWLQKWLSGPIPGQPANDDRQGHDVQPAVVYKSVPVAPSGYARPAKSLKSAVRRPSLRPRPGEKQIELPGMYLGIGLVRTSGTTTWNHDATSADATLGNPSSELTYDTVGTLAVEFNGGLKIGQDYFVRGDLGFGVTSTGDGNLRDDDFKAGQVLFSSTDSAIPNSDLFYLTADIGKEVLNVGDGRISLSLFTGFQYWREEYNAFGLYNRLTGQPSQADDVAVISDVVEWKSWRVGALTTYQPTDRLSWVADLAFVPYTVMHNEDSHLLRTSPASLGPAPNVIMDGSGFGFQGSLGMTYKLTPRWTTVLDFRYWQLVSDGQIVLKAQTTPTPFPLNDLNSVRYGINAGLRYDF